MGLSLIHWVIVLAIVVLLFGAGRIPNVMGDVAKGIKAFRAGLKEEEPVAGEVPAPITQSHAQAAAANSVKPDQKVG